MRILHTSDWHLGKRFHGYDRTQEQALFLDWLLDQVQQHEVDVLIVAGDVFDVPSPSHVARRLYYEFLARLGRQQREVQAVVVGGNHDSGDLLNAPAELLKPLRVHVKGRAVRTPGQPIDYTQFEIPLVARGERLTCLAVPHLHIADCPRVSPGESAVAEFYHQLGRAYEDHPHPIICTGHLYTTGARIASGSGEDSQIPPDTVGTLERITLADFPAHFRYLALGHIHRAQPLERPDGATAYYSGSPLPYSFRDHQLKHGVMLVDIEGGDVARTSFLPYESPVELRVLRGSRDEILEALRAAPDGEPDLNAPFCSIVCPLQAPEPGIIGHFQQAARGKYLRLGPIQTPRPGGAARVRLQTPEPQQLSPLPIAQEEYQRQYQQPMPEDMMALLEEIVQSVERGE